MRGRGRRRQASAIIPLLDLAQRQIGAATDTQGWLPIPVIEFVARELDMPVIRVLEVATFYTQFQLQPVGTLAHVQVCGTTPCMLRGSDDIMAACKAKGMSKGHVSDDGLWTLTEVECMGNCASAPMVQITLPSLNNTGDDVILHLVPLFHVVASAMDASERDKNGRITKMSLVDAQMSLLARLSGKYFDEKATREKPIWDCAEVELVRLPAGKSTSAVQIAQQLREARAPVFLAVNKTEGMQSDTAVAEFHELGLGAPAPVSAAHGEGVRELMDLALSEYPTETPREEPEKGHPRVALVSHSLGSRMSLGFMRRNPAGCCTQKRCAS